MAQKKDDLPANVDVDLQNGGTITYASEVISTIAGVAANEIEGIAGMCISGGLSDIIGRNRNATRGVRVEIGSEEASFDLYVIVEYGQPIQKVCHDVQENVRKAIESMTGLHVVRVDVHVQGVSFEKEKQQTEINIEAAKNPALTAAAAPAGENAGQKSAKSGKKSRKKASAPKADKPESEPVKESAEESVQISGEDVPAQEAAADDENADAPREEAAADEKLTQTIEEAPEYSLEEAIADEPADGGAVSSDEGNGAAEEGAAECPAENADSPEDGEESVSWEAGPVAGGYRETAVDTAPRAKSSRKKK